MSNETTTITRDLTDIDGNIVRPKTTAEAVTISDNTTLKNYLDNERQIFTSATEPSSTEYTFKTGDIWIKIPSST